MLEHVLRWLRLIPLRFSSEHRFRPHALSPFPVVAGSVDPPEGCGTILLTSKAVARAAEPRAGRPKPGAPLPPKGGEHRLLRPFEHPPVVLVDGIPAATGLGRGRIVVPAGRHLVQVQAQASGRYWPVEVGAGAEVRLSSAVSEPYFSSVLHQRMRRFYGCFSLGPRASLRRLRKPGRAPRARFEPVGDDVTWRPVDPDDTAEPDPGSDSILRVNVVFLHDGRQERGPLRAPRTPPPETPVGAQPIPGRRRDPDAPLVEALGEELEGMGRWAQTEWRMLVRDMGWDREHRERLAEERKRLPAATGRAPWIEPPRITLGDRELPAIWGLNEYRLPPGQQGPLGIAVPGPAPVLDKETRVELHGGSRLVYRLDLTAASVTEVECYAHIKSKLDSDGRSMSEYSGRIWSGGPLRSST